VPLRQRYQLRLIPHTAAFRLLWRIQQEIPKTVALATAEFATLRLRLLKIAARIVESATRASGSPAPRPVPMQRCSGPSPSRSGPLRHRPRGRAAECPNLIHQPRKPLDQPQCNRRNNAMWAAARIRRS
jgi:hypothetical protein